MQTDFPLFPDQASTTAVHVDNLYFFLVAITAFFSILVAGLVLYFGIRYHRRVGRQHDLSAPSLPHYLELVWTAIPFVIVMVVFVWSAALFFHMSRPPDDAMNILVTGKRWMWKTQHMTGRREINELHVPLGRAVRLTMTSEDVIHSFFIPAFRVKADVFPGRYSTLWFEPTRAGRYHLFCSEYCGTKHSEMGGWVTVMEPADFQTWLAGVAPGDVTPALAGERLFTSLGCATCHRMDSSVKGPVLAGLYGRTVELADGGKVLADESYVRESIVLPNAKLVAGYAPLMPTFRGLVSEEGLLSLVEYVKSLTPPAAPIQAAAEPHDRGSKP